MPSPASEQPKTLECEIAMLGGLICSDFQRSEVLETCKLEMLTEERHRVIFAALTEMFLAGKPIGAYELLIALRAAGTEAVAGGTDAITAIIDQCPDTNGALRAAEQLREFWMRRRVVRALEDLKRGVLAPGSDDDRLNASEIMNKLSVAFSSNEGGKSVVDASDIAEDVMLNRPIRGTYPTIGIADLDKSMSLFHPGELTIVAGRPGGGKSSLMRQIIWRASISNPVLVFTLEVTKEVLIQQLCCEAAGIPFETWRDGVPQKEDDLKIVEALGEMAERKIKIFTRTRVGALQVSIALSQLSAAGLKPSAVVIDYLGLMDHGKAERNDLAVGQTTRALKLMALDRGVPIIALCQMNRESEKRGSGTEHDRPRLADLRDSGNIEQDADNILFLWKRDRDDNKATTQERVITVAKRRNGHVGDISVLFDMPRGRFFSVAQYAPPADEGGGRQ